MGDGAGDLISEGAIARAAHDTKDAITGKVAVFVGLLAAAAAAGFATWYGLGRHSALAKSVVGVISVPAAFLAASLLIFLYCVLRAPYRQRNEARAQFKNLLNGAFPNVTISLGQAMAMSVEGIRTAERVGEELRIASLPIGLQEQEGALVAFNDVRVTNRSAGRVSLTFRLQIGLISPNMMNRDVVSVDPYVDPSSSVVQWWERTNVPGKPNLGAGDLNLEAYSTASGYLIFLVPGWVTHGVAAGPLEALKKPPYQVEVREHLTDKKVTLMVPPGRYPPSEGST